MCEICHQSPCLHGCPNEDEPKAVYTCCQCGEGIYEGDRYFDSDNGPICEDCMSDMGAEDILALFGEELKTAEQEIPECDYDDR